MSTISTTRTRTDHDSSWSSTGTDSGINIWFICKSCKFEVQFHSVSQFLEHKKQVHFVELQKTKLIVFEEGNSAEYCSTIAKTTDFPFQEELLFTHQGEGDHEERSISNDEDTTSEIHIEIEDNFSNDGRISPASAVSQNSPRSTADETEDFDLKIVNDFTPNKTEDTSRLNPFVLIKRLTSQELDSALSISNSVSTKPRRQSCSTLKTNFKFTKKPKRERESKSKKKDKTNNFRLLSSRISKNTNILKSKSTEKPKPEEQDCETNFRDLPYKCSYPNCTASYKFKSLFNIHKKRHHSAFNFPLTLPESELLNYTPLKEWLAQQNSAMSASAESSELNKNNVILLEPDPTLDETELEIGPGNPIECKLCSTNLESESQVKIHVSHCWFENKNSHTYCVPCKRPFKRRVDLRKHNLKHHFNPGDYEQEPIYSCKYCSRKFLHRSNQRLHIKSHNISEISREIEESDPLTLKDWLLKQKQNATDPDTNNVNVILLDPDPATPDGPEEIQVSSENPIKCKLCCLKLDTELAVKAHVVRCWLHNKRKHSFCLPCNKQLFNHNALQVHNSVTHPPPGFVRRVFTCEICSRKFNYKTNLKIHLETHKGKEQRERKFVCEVCGAAFFDRKTLLYHQYRLDHVSGQIEKAFKCSHPNCTKEFFTRTLLKSHMLVHSNSKAFTCPHEDCSKSYKTSSHLKEHLKGPAHNDKDSDVMEESRRRKSRGVHPCTAEDCDKVYVSRGGLKRHLKTEHDIGEALPVFTCSYCNKGFIWKISLKKHLMIHEDSKPFKCSHVGCDKAYREKLKLIEHERVHTGERPHQCELCGKDYARARSLKFHMDLHNKSAGNL